MKNAAEQFSGLEGETAAFIWRSLVSLTLREFGFAPRHLSRSPLLRWQRGNRTLLVLDLKT